MKLEALMVISMLLSPCKVRMMNTSKRMCWTTGSEYSFLYLHHNQKHLSLALLSHYSISARGIGFVSRISKHGLRTAKLLLDRDV